MKFRFGPNQEYQLEAIRSVADLFDGQPFIRGGMQFKSGTVALSVAGLAAEGSTTIDTAEAVSVTFPDFTDLMRAAGAGMELVA